MPEEELFKRWCRRLKASDRDAYEQVFRALHDALLRYALRITGNDEAAQDVVQDVFVKLWTVRSRLDPDRSLKAFLYRMVRNRAYNRQRNRRTRSAKHALLRQERQHHPADRPDHQANGKLLDTHMQAWIDELPERQREALVLSRYEGLSHDEVAAVMEISPRTVNNHLVRALKHLRDRLHDHEPNLLPTS